MKIRILAVGKQKPSPTLDLCREYMKRMKWPVTLREVEARGGVKAEAEALSKELDDKGGMIVALDERGDSFSSADFARKIQEWQNRLSGNTLTFVIGGADGLTDEIRKKSDLLLSFGKQTWPHRLVRVMLLEQIYRAQQIIGGHPYHRE